MPAGKKNQGAKDKGKLNKIRKAKDAFDADEEMSREFVKPPLSHSCRPSCDEK